MAGPGPQAALDAVALANKVARIAWMILARSINFQPGYATGDSAKVARRPDHDSAPTGKTVGGVTMI